MKKEVWWIKRIWGAKKIVVKILGSFWNRKIDEIISVADSDPRIKLYEKTTQDFSCSADCKPKKSVNFKKTRRNLLNHNVQPKKKMSYYMKLSLLI